MVVFKKINGIHRCTSTIRFGAREGFLLFPGWRSTNRLGLCQDLRSGRSRQARKTDYGEQGKFARGARKSSLTFRTCLRTTGRTLPAWPRLLRVLALDGIGVRLGRFLTCPLILRGHVAAFIDICLVALVWLLVVLVYTVLIALVLL